MNVSAVLVTRGNVDMSQITDAITDAGIDDVVIWDNSQRAEDLSCFGRYAGIAEAKHDLIYHQDDDLLPNIPALLRCYDPVRDRYSIVANNRIDEEWPLTAIGSVFHRDLAEHCFDAYISEYGYGPKFFRISDVVFAYTNAYRRVVVGYKDLPWASEPWSSMYLEDDHMAVRFQARQRVFDLTAVAA